MMHISGQDRSQTLLLPELLDDFVGGIEHSAVHRGFCRWAGSCRGRVHPRSAKGDGPPWLCAGRSPEALHLRIACPTLVVAGAKDPRCPPVFARIMAEAIHPELVRLEISTNAAMARMWRNPNVRWHCSASSLCSDADIL